VRIAWFSPFPPVRSGISAYSTELLPLIESSAVIDRYPESSAHDFVWKSRREPYDLVVYQLGNAPCHDYMWAYLVRYPGFVVLHDARLHHARARHLLQHNRVDDYRREYEYDHPDSPPGFADYAIAGLSGPIYYFCPMLRVVIRTARLVAVHNERVARDLADRYHGLSIETIRMGVPPSRADAGARRALRREWAIPDDAVAFAVFGKVTAEKRIGVILSALQMLVREGRAVFLVIAGDAADYPTLRTEISGLGIGDRVRITDHIDASGIGPHLAAADACVCLRWPTALETSASWLRCLAAGRPTIITDLPHLVDIPADVAMRVDLLNEERSLEAAMRRLADQPRLRDEVGHAGQRHWETHHRLELMAADYRRLLPAAASRPAPTPSDLPGHFLDDYSGLARATIRRFGVPLDILD
jgi:glycosyltransferase involved in cell wall biosynthesis